jgi:Uma2 family endonuclease
MEIEVTKKLFTVDEYYRMGEAGIFDPEARLELIEGEIIEMSPVGTRHIACVNRATALFASKLAGKAMISIQNPVVLSRYTEPQPDVLLARPRADYYSSKRISAEDTVLAIEIQTRRFVMIAIAKCRSMRKPAYQSFGSRIFRTT